MKRVFDSATSTSVYALAPTDLYTRALLELIELLNDQPPVAICAHCKRLFVQQRKGDKYCRRYIWPIRSNEVIAGCLYDSNPTPLRASLESRTRRNESKRRQMRVARLAKDLGRDHPDTRREQAAFDEWKKTHPVPKGRRPAPMPPDLLLDSGRA
jgi:hypothetical protein